jgi:GMP synthase (glutamine-hydrolysing)
MDNLIELTGLAKEVDKILIAELSRTNIQSDSIDVRIYDVKTIGVQGDQKTYAYVAEITLFNEGKAIWDSEFMANLSNRITNNLKGINRVVYLIGSKKYDDKLK